MKFLIFFLRTKAKLKPVGLVKSCIGEVGQELNRYSQPGIIGQLDAKVSEKDVHIHAFFLCCPAEIDQLVKVLI